jgi:LacI family repressor for deo operon, udp, cdd, tsx, nupC, and nupG
VEQPGESAPSPKGRQRTLAGKVSLAEIAAVAQVSEATVSRVLNRKYGVAKATREVVDRAMRDLGYERKISGELVLLLTPNLTNPIFAELCDRVESELSPHGLRAVICPVSPGTAQERDYVEALADAGTAAVVFLSSSNTIRNSDPTARDMLSSRGIPFVSVNGGFDGVAAPVFSSDDARAAEIAVAHLFQLGHRRIGMCAGPVGNTPADRRVEGFVQAMEKRGVRDCEDLVVRQYFSIDGGRHAADQLLDVDVTAIVASSDEMALGAIRAAQRRGKSVPRDISIIGYDDSYMLDFTDPPLTTVRQPVELLAESVTRAIVSMIAKRPVGTDEMFIEPSLRLRESTGPVPD